MLYIPWRSDENLKKNDNYKTKYEEVVITINNNMKKYRQSSHEEVDDACDYIEANAGQNECHCCSDTTGKYYDR